MSFFNKLNFNKPTEPNFQEQLTVIIENFHTLLSQDSLMAHARLVPNEDKQVNRVWLEIKDQIKNNINTNAEDYEEIQTKLKQIFERWYNIKTYKQPL